MESNTKSENKKDIILKALQKQGWKSSDLISEPFLHYGERVLNPDFVLSVDGYPVAVIEVLTTIEKPDLLQLLASYKECLNVEHVFVYCNGNIFEPSSDWNTLEVLTSFPNKKHTVGKVESYIPSTDKPQLDHLHQMQAVVAIWDSIKTGRKKINVQMASGSGRSFTEIKLISKLLKLPNTRKILVIKDRNSLKEEYEQQLSDNDIDFSNALEFPFKKSLCVFSIDELSELINEGNFPPDGFDFVILNEIHRSISIEDKLSFFADATLISFTSQWSSVRDSKKFGEPVFRYSLADAIETDFLTPPEGFTTERLGELAHVTVGRNVKMHKGSSNNDNSENINLPRMITARDLVDPFNENKLSYADCPKTKKYLSDLKPGDILLSRLYATQPSVLYVEREINEPLIISQSVIHIRPFDEKEAKNLYFFLNSNTGKKALNNYATRGESYQTNISTKLLEQLKVFIPIKTQKEDISLLFSSARASINEIKAHILPLLEKLERSYSSEEGSNKAELEEAGRRLMNIARDITPKSLEERVLTTFPMPIAVPYQRFLNARFNVFEQVMRLRDVYESICFFVYNVLLADSCRRLDKSKFHVDEAKARMAFNDFSMASRLSFIECIQKNAKQNGANHLFISEYVDSFDIEAARKLKDDFRNQSAHTATASETQQKKVLEHFKPVVENMLEQLSFLEKYQIVRIPSYYFKGNDFVRRLEVYAGTSPVIDEQTIDYSSSLTPADRQHLVIIDQDDNVLDLHPVYQVISNEETRFESHLCFLKQRHGGSKAILEGESVQGAFNLEIEGFEELEKIRKNLQLR